MYLVYLKKWSFVHGSMPMRNGKAPQQDFSPRGGRLVCRADLVWAPLNPLKAWRVERYWRWATHAKQQSPTAGFRPNGWPFGLQSRSRLGTFEPAKNLESGEVFALGNPCETAEPLQDSGPMGGRLVCRAGSASVVPADSDSVVPADFVSVMPAVV